MRARDDQKEQAIREKAIGMIVQEGIDGLTMKKLAAAAGVSPATIYIYFKDREDMILQILFESTNNMLKATFENFDPDMHFNEGMRIQWMNRAVYFMKNPMEVQFLELMKHSPLNEQAMGVQVATFKEQM